MSEAPFEQQRLETALARILKRINDLLNKPPRQDSLLADLQFRLAEAQKRVAQGLSEEDALVQVGSAARSIQELEEQIAVEQAAPPLPDQPPPQRQVYTLDDARTVLADSHVMAKQLFVQRTGRQPDAEQIAAIGFYLIDNLLSDQRGAPASFSEEFAEQIVSVQGEAIARDPASITLTARLRDFYTALRDSDNPNAQISQATFNALAFPATPFDQVPARHRARVPLSGAAEREAELAALDVINSLVTNMPANLQKFASGSAPTFQQGAARIAAAQTEEEVVGETNTLPSVGSPSDIRAKRRDEDALSALETETSTKKAVEDQVGSPGLITDADEQKNKTQAIREVVDRLQSERRDFLSNNRGASKEEIAAHLAPFLSQEVGSFDQTLARVAQAADVAKFGDLASTKAELIDILGAAGLDSAEIDADILTQAAQFVMESDDPVGTAQGVVRAFPTLQAESQRLEQFGDLKTAEATITQRLGESGLDASEIPPDILSHLAFGAVQGGDIDTQTLVDVFPALQQIGRDVEAQETRTEAGTIGGATSLRNQALFDLGETPASFTTEQLDAMNQFIAASGGIEGFDEVFGPRLEQFKQQKVLEGIGTGGGVSGRLGTGGIPTFRELEALRSEGLGIAPTGAIAPIREGQVQTPTSVRGDIARQLGQTGLSLPKFRQEELSGDFGPLLRQAAGDDLAFLQFALEPEQTRNLQIDFREAQRQDVREQRVSLREAGIEASRGRRLAREGLARVDREGLARVGPGGMSEIALREAEAGFAGQIRTATQLGRLATSGLTAPQFFESRIGGIRETFARSPAGIAEARRVESEVERDRRRALRSGRTVFRRI
ncbi:hypothetical protein LCGC14_0695330 [marine sediment metagenome]|uniref:Uncharacterized protein n=1 Tax=marine sediment metagenome TaxID=412755 RepID=A0A0F9R4M6_9ZZZZ